MDIFIFGTIWFWLLVAIASIFVILSLEKESWGGTGATLTFVVACMIIYWFGGKEDLEALGRFLMDSPIRSLFYILTYFGIGVGWSFIKWYFFLLNCKDRILQKEYISQHDLPQAKENYGRIISWMCYWIFSMAWTIINDPVRRTFRFLYMKLEGVYQAIADKMFADIQVKIKNKKQ